MISCQCDKYEYNIRKQLNVLCNLLLFCLSLEKSFYVSFSSKYNSIILIFFQLDIVRNGNDLYFQIEFRSTLFWNIQYSHK